MSDKRFFPADVANSDAAKEGNANSDAAREGNTNKGNAREGNANNDAAKEGNTNKGNAREGNANNDAAKEDVLCWRTQSVKHKVAQVLFQDGVPFKYAPELGIVFFAEEGYLQRLTERLICCYGVSLKPVFELCNECC